jgi:two-component system response regulator
MNESLSSPPELESGRHVVVVEDNENDAMMTIRALRQIEPPPEVTVLVDGESAVNSLTGNEAIRPRLIFLDLKLPKVHGLEVLKAIKTDEGARNVPVLVLSSSDEPIDVETATALGCDGYLRKPITWSEYKHVVIGAASKFLPVDESKAG